MDTLNPKRFYKDLTRFIYWDAEWGQWRVRVGYAVDSSPTLRQCYDFRVLGTTTTNKDEALPVARRVAQAFRTGTDLGVAPDVSGYYRRGWRLREYALDRLFVSERETDLNEL